jgi:hypothetical protein
MAVLLGAFPCATLLRVRAEEPARSTLRVEGAPAFQGVVYRFFDDHTGLRTGQLKIGRIDMEYRRQGFLRVAWRPLVVLDRVELDIGADLAWPEQGSQISRELLTLGGRDELVLRDVRVRLAGEAGRLITASTGRFLPGGVLEFLEATDSASDHPRGTMRLHLTGPHAGQWSRHSALAAVPTASPIISTKLTRSAPTP